MSGFGNGEKDNAVQTRILQACGWEETEPGSWRRTPDTPRGGDPEYHKVLDERRTLHMEKSSGYGTGKDPFANFSAVAYMTGQPRYLYPVHRTIEKLTRVLSLHEQGRVEELEEEFKDCASLLDCATAMLRSDGRAT